MSSPASCSLGDWKDGDLGHETRTPPMSTSILVVEDEPAIQELLRMNLEDAGFTVHTVADAESAQALIRHALPDLDSARLDAARTIGPRVCAGRCAATRAPGSCRSSW